MKESQARQEIKARIALEKKIVRKLIRELKAAGYLPTQVWDSEQYVEVSGERDTIEAVFAVDDSTIHFDGGKGKNGHEHGVYLVCGNGCDIISDYHIGDEAFDKVVSAVMEEL